MNPENEELFYKEIVRKSNMANVLLSALIAQNCTINLQEKIEIMNATQKKIDEINEER